MVRQIAKTGGEMWVCRHELKHVEKLCQEHGKAWSDIIIVFASIRHPIAMSRHMTCSQELLEAPKKIFRIHPKTIAIRGSRINTWVLVIISRVTDLAHLPPRDTRAFDWGQGYTDYDFGTLMLRPGIGHGA